MAVMSPIADASAPASRARLRHAIGVYDHAVAGDGLGGIPEAEWVDPGRLLDELRDGAERLSPLLS